MNLLGSSKPDQPLVLQLHLQRTVASHHGVQPYVKLVVIDQQWVGDVLTNNNLRAVEYLGLLISNINTLALRHVGGFDDVPLVRVLVHVRDERGRVRGHDLGLRQEVEPLLAEVVLHALHVLEHVVLARQLIAGGEVVDALVALQTAEDD